jgi:hypothetical protein
MHPNMHLPAQLVQQFQEAPAGNANAGLSEPLLSGPAGALVERGEQARAGIQSDSELLTGQKPDDIHGQLITCRLEELRPHPSYVQHHLTVPAPKLSALAAADNLSFLEPLLITHDGTILDGYARWELARLQGRQTLPCIQYELTEEEALRWLLLRHCRSNGLNDFCRIHVALDLEPYFKGKALSNQRAGGRMKGSSNLTEAARLDVRREIATAAGVSVGNVTKVKQLIGAAHPELLEALRAGEVSIHRAWKWSVKSQERQTEALRTYCGEKGVKKAIRDLISRHELRSLPTAPELGSLVLRLSQLKADERSPINLSVIRIPGKTIFVTEELLQSLPPHQESMLT